MGYRDRNDVFLHRNKRPFINSKSMIFFCSGNQLKCASSALNYYLHKQKFQPLHE